MASAANGRTHGLSASKCLLDDERARIAERTAELEKQLRPEGPEQKREVAEIAAADVRIEMCDLDEENWRHHRAERAEYYWEEDRRAEAEKLFARIERKPAQTVRALRQSLQGARRLRTAFAALAARIARPAAGEPPRPLDEAGRARCFDLMALDPEERGGAGTSPLDLPDGQAGDDAALVAHQAAVIAAEIAELDALTSEKYQELDEQNRVDIMLGNFPGIDQQTRLIRRYRSEAERRGDRHRAELHRLQDEAGMLDEDGFLWDDEPADPLADMLAHVERLSENSKAAPPPEPQTGAESPAPEQAAAAETSRPAPARPAPAANAHIDGRRLSRRERKALKRQAANASRRS
jgi:hypothetical protein